MVQSPLLYRAENEATSPKKTWKNSRHHFRGYARKYMKIRIKNKDLKKIEMIFLKSVIQQCLNRNKQAYTNVVVFQ